MSLADYTSLQAAVATWMDRTDLTAAIPDFITLFETTANAELPLRTRFNLAAETLSTTAGAAAVALPTSFLEAKSLVNQVDPKEVLDFYAPTALYTQFPQASTGCPKGFTYVGGTIELAPVPDGVYALRLYYYQRVSALSATNATNWLLSNFPNLYLFGSLLAAEAYLGTDPRLKLWGDLYENLVQKLASANERGQYGGASLSVKIDAVA